MLEGQAADLVSERLCEEALAVVRDGNGIDFVYGLLQITQRPRQLRIVGGRAPLAIHSHDLLVAGNDACLYRSGGHGILEYSRGINSRSMQQGEQALPWTIGPGNAHNRDMFCEF